MANKVKDLKKARDGLDVWPDLLRYSKLGYECITPDDMTRFRWYGIYEQVPKDGHFMMRVKIPGGDIRADQWRALGGIARDYGRGIDDLTTVGACGDITRNIAGCPVAGIDPDEIYDCRDVINDITRYFVGNKEFSDL